VTPAQCPFAGRRGPDKHLTQFTHVAEEGLIDASSYWHVAAHLCAQVIYEMLVLLCRQQRLAAPD
jgi:hypothetical protein